MVLRFIIIVLTKSLDKPCEVYYLSLFYTRKEMAFRVSWIGQMGFIAVSGNVYLTYEIHLA